AHPDSADERGESEDENGNRECERNLRDGPVECFSERRPEDAPGVDRAKRNLHDDSGESDLPAIGCARSHHVPCAWEPASACSIRLTADPTVSGEILLGACARCNQKGFERTRAMRCQFR